MLGVVVVSCSQVNAIMEFSNLNSLRKTALEFSLSISPHAAVIFMHTACLSTSRKFHVSPKQEGGRGPLKFLEAFLH